MNPSMISMMKTIRMILKDVSLQKCHESECSQLSNLNVNPSMILMITMIRVELITLMMKMIRTFCVLNSQELERSKMNTGVFV